MSRSLLRRARAGVVPLPDFDLAGQKWTLRGCLKVSIVQPGHELSQRGVTRLAPWQASIIAFVPRLVVEPAPDAAQRPT